MSTSFSNWFHSQAHINAKGCDFSMNECENPNTFILPDICKILNMKNQYWSDLAAHTYPRVKCPLKASTMEIRNAITDLSFLSNLPVDGFVWTINFKIFKPIPNVRHKKRLLYCMIIEGSVVRGRRNPKSEKGVNGYQRKDNHWDD